MVASIDAAGTAAAFAPRTNAASLGTASADAPNPAPGPGDAGPPDDTADAALPQAISDALARRAQLLLLVARARDQTQEARLDAMRSDFDNQQQERAEMLRESNALRDMAMEQMKHDDEILKKYIALI